MHAIQLQDGQLILFTGQGFSQIEIHIIEFTVALNFLIPNVKQNCARRHSLYILFLLDVTGATNLRGARCSSNRDETTAVNSTPPALYGTANHG